MIFSKKNNNLEDYSLKNSEDLHTIIGYSSEFIGNLSFNGSIRIDGKFKGEIISDDFLIIGSTAILEAKIVIGSIIIHGSVKGDIFAKVSVELSETAVLEGNISTPIIIVREGAIFNGSCLIKK